MPKSRKKRVRARNVNRLRKLRSSGNVTTGNVPSRNYLATRTAGVTQSLRRTLVWCYITSVAVGIGYNEQIVLVLNNPYDPDYAVGGASAVGFSKYMAFYSKCFTLGARVKVRAAYDYTGDVQVQYEPIITGVTITTTGSSIGSTLAAITDGLVNYELTSSSPSRVMLTESVDVGKYLHKPYVLDDPDLFCTDSGGPSQIVCAHVWTDNRGSGHTHGTYVFEVEMDCVFTDPIQFT